MSEDYVGESRKKSLYEVIPSMDKEKAMKYVLRGILVVIIFGIIMMISALISAYSTTWMEMAISENKMNYWNGDYGYNEYIVRQNDIRRISYWMDFQGLIFITIGRIGVFIGFFFVFVGLMGFVTNDSMDQRTRWICLILAGTIIIALLLSLILSLVSDVMVGF